MELPSIIFYLVIILISIVVTIVIERRLIKRYPHKKLLILFLSPVIWFAISFVVSLVCGVIYAVFVNLIPSLPKIEPL